MGRSRHCARAALAWLAVASCAALGQSPMGYLPADTLMFVSLPDLDRSAERLRQTALHQVWADPDAQPVLRRIGDAIQTAALRNIDRLKPKREAAARLTADDFRGVFGGQVTLAVFGFDVKQTPPLPSAALVVGIKDAARFEALCGKLDAAMTNGSAPNAKLRRETTTLRGTPVVVWTDGSRYELCRARMGRLGVLTVTKAAMDRVLGGLVGAGGPTVSSSHALQQVHARLGGAGCDLLAYADLTRLKPDHQAGEQAVCSLAFGLAITPPGIKDALYLHAPGRRHALLAAVRTGHVSTDLFALAPRDARAACVGRLDLGCLWDGLLAVAADVSPSRHQAFVTRLHEIETSLAVSVKGHVLGSLGEDFALVKHGPGDGSAAPGLARWSLTWRVRDAARLRSALAKLTGLTNAAEGKEAGPRWRQIAHAGATINCLDTGIPKAMPCYAVTREYVVVALHPDVAKRALAQLSARGPDIRSSEGFQRVTERVTRPAVVLDYSPRDETLDAAGALVCRLLKRVPGSGPGLPADLAALLREGKVAKPMFGAASSFTCDEQGLCWESYSPVGGVAVSLAAAADLAAEAWDIMSGLTLGGGGGL